MCGGCGGGAAAVDWASAALTARGARQEVARTAGDLCRRAGLRVTVRAEPSGWVVASATGRSTVAATLTQLWTAMAGFAGSLPELPALGPHASKAQVGTGASIVPPSQRIAVQLGGPGGAASGAAIAGWASCVVDVEGPGGAMGDALDAALGGGTPVRVLLRCRDERVLRHAVTVAATFHRRAAVTALVRIGPGPSWCDDVSTLPPAAVVAMLDGDSWPRSFRAGSLPAAATWLTGQVAAGATRGRRCRVIVGTAPGVVLDVADGIGLAVRGVRAPA